MMRKATRLFSKHLLCAAAIAATAGLLSACSSATPPPPGKERSDPREADYSARMIEAIKDISRQRAGPDQIVRRFNQVKTLACYDASFSVDGNLPANLRQGIFSQPQTYPAQLRFANATQMDDREKDFRGLSIKLQGIAGEPLWGNDGEQDFLLNSYPVLFAATPQHFLEFIEATRDDQVWRYFINPRHFYSLLVVLKGRTKIANPFAIRYWSTTPYRLGADSDTAVKYSVRPCDEQQAPVKVESHANFLRDAMQQHLQQRGHACFKFMVQLQADPKTMPIEDASALWSESESPFIKVATIQIAPDATSDATAKGCEAMTFSPWQSLPAHRPLGGINRTRLPIYSEIGRFRSQQNATPRQP